MACFDLNHPVKRGKVHSLLRHYDNCGAKLCLKREAWSCAANSVDSLDEPGTDGNRLNSWPILALDNDGVINGCHEVEFRWS